MDAYKYFDMSLPPFEARPDPRFFLGLPVYAEALATLQYTVRTGKSCAVVVGDSGAGKTLLARVLAESVNRSGCVLWIHGIGQPADVTEVTAYTPGALINARNVRGREEQTTLATWLRTPLGVSPMTLVVVDNADALGKQHWLDLLALLTRDVRGPRHATLALFGSPDLLDRLANPRLARLRRRVFRTCGLSALSCAQTASYIEHRIRQAGAERNPFTQAAVDRIHRFARGTPGAINHLADNALIDAFGDDRQTIDASHIDGTVHAITGAFNPPDHLLPAPATDALATVDDTDSTGDADAHSPATAAGSTRRRKSFSERLAQVTRTVAAHIESSRELLAEPTASDAAQERRPAQPPIYTTDVKHAADTAAPAPTTSVKAPPATSARPAGTSTTDRLKTIESRINLALDRVRSARRQGRPPASDSDDNAATS